LTTSCTVIARAFKTDYEPSDFASADFTINPPNATPLIVATAPRITGSTLSGQGTRDFKVNPVTNDDGSGGIENDLSLENFDLVLIDGVEQIRQQLKIRLQFFAGEWYLDTTVGTRYYQDVLIKNPELSKLQSLFKAVIVGTLGITALTAFDLSVDNKSRTTTLSFTVMTLYGTLQMQETL
jgi:hypothetical protein